MQIVDIFHLSMGGTTLVGNISREIPLIDKNQYMANLVIDGSIYQDNIHIAGEWLGRSYPDRHRAILTTEVIDLTSDFIKSHDCQLVLIEC